jgi:hypothetical protein
VWMVSMMMMGSEVPLAIQAHCSINRLAAESQVQGEYHVRNPQQHFFL